MKYARTSEDKIIAGVAGGIARYFGVSTFIIRLTWVLLLMIYGIGLLFYLILWLAVPSDKEIDVYKADVLDEEVHGRDDEVRKDLRIWGLAILLVGMVFLGQAALGSFAVYNIFAIGLIVVGTYMILYSRRVR